jgi:hypothetical protein
MLHTELSKRNMILRILMIIWLLIAMIILMG